MRFFIFMFGLMALIATPALAEDSTTVPANKAEVDAMLEEIMTIMEGEWDNSWYVREQEAKNAPTTHRQRHHHSIFRRMELPNLGKHAIFAQKWRDNDPDNIYVVNVYIFTPDYKLGGVHLEILNPRNIQTYRDAHQNLDTYKKLKALPVSAFYRMPHKCSTYMKKDKNGIYRGSFIEPCFLGKMNDGRDSIADTDLRMTKNLLWVTSSSRDINNYDTVGNLGHVSRAEIKARFYKCHMRVSNRVIPLPLERFNDVANGVDGVARFRNFNLHDQGGEVSLTVNSTTPETFRIRLTNHRNPDHSISDDPMVLEVFAAGSDVPVARGISDPSAEWIGMESGDIYALCEKKPGDWYNTNSMPERKLKH